MTRSKPSSITIRDIARHAKVSVATVSRYINATTPVSDNVAARVQAAVSALNYVPQASARRLATHKTHAIGLLVSEMHGDFFGPMFSGIESVTSAAGYDLLISSRAGSGPHNELPGGLGPHNTDGLLVFGDSLSEAGLRRACELGFPVVLIHQSPPSGLAIPCVTVENKAASKRMVEHLITVHGRRRIAFLRGPENNEDSYWRETGYRQALDQAGLPSDEQLVGRGDFERKVAQATITAMLQAGLDFDAVFAGDDESAVGVLTALRAACRRVPEEVSVAGFDDQRLSEHLTPPLTTVRAPTEEVGRQAAQQLLNLLQKRHAEPLVLLPSELVIRQSCGCAARSQL